jgi:hypothetical protein
MKEALLRPKEPFPLPNAIQPVQAAILPILASLHRNGPIGLERLHMLGKPQFLCETRSILLLPACCSLPGALGGPSLFSG